MISKYQNLLKKLAHIQTKNPYLSLLAILIFTTVIFGGTQYVRTVASLENMLPGTTPEIAAFNELRDYGLGQDMIGIIVEINPQSMDSNGIVDVTDYELYKYLVHMDTLFLGQQDILDSFSYVSLVGKKENGEPYDSATFYSIINSNQLKSQLSRFVNADKTNTIMILTTDVGANDERMILLSNQILSVLDSSGHPPGVSIKITGIPRIQQRLGEMIASDRVSTQNISTLFVFVITMLIFGTFTSAIVPILIVTLTVNWLYGTMGYTGLPISTLAGGVAAMVIGIGIDYALHLMNKFKYERKKGMGVENAIEEAVSDTGLALTGAAFATIIAFMAFVLGDMPEMARFGILMSIGVGYAFVFSLFGLPALLILEERAINYLRKKLRFGVEGEFRLLKSGEVCPKNHVAVVHPTLRGHRIAVKNKDVGGDVK